MNALFGCSASRLVLIVTYCSALVFATSAFGQFEYSKQSYLIDLNTGQLTHINGYGMAINDVGQVVGARYSLSTGVTRAFITGPNGQGMTDLGTLGGRDSVATDINDAGQVVGYSHTSTGSLRAFITDPNGQGMTDLGTLGGEHSLASGINNTGRVVGRADVNAGHGIPVSRAFTTGPNGTGMTELSALAGLARFSNASDLNDAGQVVGTYDPSDDPSVPLGHAFITGLNGQGITDLGNGSAHGVNSAGQIIGKRQGGVFISGPNGEGKTFLGTLGGSYSTAFGMNDAGQVVGVSHVRGGPFGILWRGFVTGPNGQDMMDLSALVGVDLSSARDINNNGQIIAVIAIPEPASYATMLCGLALMGLILRRRRTAAA